MEEEQEEDPRAELIRRLQEYERFKKAAEDIDDLPRVGRDIHQATAEAPDRQQQSLIRCRYARYSDRVC